MLIWCLLSQDYPADHPNIEILRLRNYTIGRKLKDNEVLGSKGLDRICEIIKVMVPFVRPQPPSHLPA